MSVLLHPAVSADIAKGSPLERWRVLAILVRAALDIVDTTTDFPPTIERAAQLRRRADNFDLMIERAHGHAVTIEAVAIVALGKFGPNGLWRAVNDVLAQAAFHGRAIEAGQGR